MREALVERVIERARALVPGDPLDPATELGAIVGQSQLERILGYMAGADKA